MPRAASLQAFDTPSSPGVRCSSATLSEPVAAPCRRLVERVVDLEIALAVAVFPDVASASLAGHRAAEQPVVELRRRDRADDALAAQRSVSPEASRTPVARPLVWTIEATSAPVRISPPRSLISASKAASRLLRAALDDRRAGRLQRKGDDLGDLAGEGIFRAEPGMQHPGRPQRARWFPTGRCFPASRAPASAPRRGRRQGRAGRAARPRPPAAWRSDSSTGRRRAGRTAGRHCARSRRHRCRCWSPSPAAIALKAATLAARSVLQHGMAAVRPQHAGRRAGVAEFQPVPAEIGGKCRIGRRGDEQHEGRRHHIMDEAGRGDLLGADAAADAVVALEHQHLARPCRQASPRRPAR